MKNVYFLLFILTLVSCSNEDQLTKNAFIGTWHLVSTQPNIMDKGVLMYSQDGQMTAILNKKDKSIIGYCGKYEINTKLSFVTHYRDFYASLPEANDSTPPVYIRDFELSADKKTLILRPREEAGLSLTWKKVSQ
jgi:hypothetical protein